MIKKTLSLGIIASQLLFAVAGNCATPASTLSPEQSLLTTVIALRGENLSAEQWKAETTEAFKEYVQTSQADGRNERLQQAMVNLGIYTPAQAAQVMTSARSAGAHLATATDATAKTQVQVELGTLLKTMPQGAQYSSCYTAAADLERVGIAGFIVGMVGILAQGNNVPVGNWASVTALSSFALCLIGVGVSYGC